MDRMLDDRFTTTTALGRGIKILKFMAMKYGPLKVQNFKPK